MATGEPTSISVSRRIRASATEIFQVLADPDRHRELDGSGMLRGVASGVSIHGVGDVFVMDMFFDELGQYQMINHVVEYDVNRRVGWEPEAGRGHPNAETGAERHSRWGQRWSFGLVAEGPDVTVVTETFDCSRVPEEQRVDIDNGKIWVGALRQTLERLDWMCATRSDRTCEVGFAHDDLTPGMQ